MDIQEKKINEFKEEFKKEMEGIKNIEELKDLFAKEIARRDLLIDELRKQNQILMKTAFKQKSESVRVKKVGNEDYS